MYNKKKLPKSQYELSQGKENQEFERHNDIRRDNDTLKELSIGLRDIDFAIKYYFDNVIKPEVEEFGTKVKVPVMFGSPEKWKNIQADGYFRDNNGKIQSPLIAYKRTGIAKNRMLGSKVDANFPQLYYTQEVKYTQGNKYDQFSKLTNSKPVKTYINTVIPDYIDITYDVIVWTDYVESMNTIVESLIYSEGSYWGDMERFKFRAKIDNFTNTIELPQDGDRVVRTTFQLMISGQIVPDVLAKELSKKQSLKAFDSRQLVMEMTPDADPSVFQQKEDLTTGAATFTTPTVRTVINPASLNDSTILAYLNINKTVMAASVSVPNTAIFNAAWQPAPSVLPTTSVANFTFFINGQFVEPTAITSFVDNGNGTCTLTTNTSELGFTLASTDEIAAIGKFV
jgi:hypothetical protein